MKNTIIRRGRFMLGLLVCALGWASTLWAAEPYDAALEYVESDGSQYLDTGLVLSNDVSVTMEFALTTTNANGRVFGGRTGTSTNNISIFLYGKGVYADFNNGDYSPYRASAGVSRIISDRFRVEISANMRRIFWDNGYQWQVLASNLVENTTQFCTEGTARIFDRRAWSGLDSTCVCAVLLAAD